MGYLIAEILLFLLLAAILGFVVGWLLRGTRVRSELQDLDARWRRRLSEVEGDRDRFVAELTQANEAKSKAEAALAAAQEQAAGAAGGDLIRLQEDLAVAKQHALSLEQALSESRQAYADFRAQAAREQASAAPAPDEDALAVARQHALGLEQELSKARQAHADALATIRKLEEQLAERGSADPQNSDQAAPSQAKEAAPVAAHAMAAPEVAVPAAAEALGGARPEGLSAPRGTADDLKRISGVGPKLERTLNELGIFHFWQIAQFTRDNVAWVDQYLRFKGRIDRENWIEQAKALAASSGTDASQRLDG